MKNTSKDTNIELEETRMLLDTKNISDSTLQHSSRFVITPVANASLPLPQDQLTYDDYSNLLLRHVKDNRIQKVKELLEAGGPELEPSIISTRSNYLFQDKFKFNIDIQDEYKQTPLLIATRLDLTQIAVLLIEHSASVNVTDSDNWTPLLNSAKNGNLQLCQMLISKKATIDARECGQFTPLLWACYKNRVDVVKLLLRHNANPNAQCTNAISCLCWASGRGYVDIVNELLGSKGIKVNLQDQNSSTPLLWAARKGALKIIESLIKHDADPNVAGMLNMTPLIAACKFGFTDCALYLSSLPNINLNQIDKDGNTALQISAKNGLPSVALNLLEKKAYINTPNLKGDSILITAVKAGNKQIIDQLLQRHVAIDAIGNNSKTAMYHAIDKGNLEIVKALLLYKPDLEIDTNEGDTLLLCAVKKKSPNIVAELLAHGSKVSPVDKYGDNVLHVSLRNRSKEITEMILANPKNSKYLYKPNKQGDTPHKIDASNPKSILTQILGHRQLNMTEDSILGYDLYSSALAEILSEPCLRTPITVGIYAKWGSGKSFLLSQLKNEMKSFARLTRVVDLKLNLSAVVTIIFINALWTFGFGLWKWFFGLALFLSFSAIALIIVKVCKYAFEKRQQLWAERACENISRQLNRFKLFLRILFLNPAKFKNEQEFDHKNLRFIFTEYGKISTLGGENALAYMIASLNTKIENQMGTAITRLCRVFYHKSHSHSKFRRICCIPSFVLVILVFMLLVGSILFFRIRGFKIKMYTTEEMAVISSILFVIFVSVFGSIFTWFKIILSLLRSPSTRILNVLHNKQDKLANSTNESKVESIIFKLKKEVDLLAHTVRTIDSFTHGCTRLVIVIDGLDSCEQSKVIQILEIVHVLFTREDDPYICILAVDPHVLTKGIEGNLNAVLRNGNVNGHDYLRTVIHLPVYLQVDLAKARAISKLETLMKDSMKKSLVSQISQESITIGDTRSSQKKTKTKPMPNNYDITDQLLKSDYFLDVNPRNLRRLINIIALTGRLLRAYSIDFNWKVLASWIYLNEQWPYRCSWINFYYDENQTHFNEETTLNHIYELVKNQIPTSNEPLLELDRNPLKFEQFLQNCSPHLTAVILKKILPCTCNLDPYLIKLIRESIEAQNHEKVSSILGNTFLKQSPSQSNFIDFSARLDASKPTLEKMTVDDVCDAIMVGIDFLGEKFKSHYVTNIRAKNINGMVLIYCDLDQELRQELQMNYGDWQLFKNWISRQRLFSSQYKAPVQQQNQPLTSTNKKINFFLKEIDENEAESDNCTDDHDEDDGDNKVELNDSLNSKTDGSKKGALKSQIKGFIKRQKSQYDDKKPPRPTKPKENEMKDNGGTTTYYIFEED